MKYCCFKVSGLTFHLQGHTESWICMEEKSVLGLPVIFLLGCQIILSCGECGRSTENFTTKIKSSTIDYLRKQDVYLCVGCLDYEHTL